MRSLFKCSFKLESLLIVLYMMSSETDHRYVPLAFEDTCDVEIIR